MQLCIATALATAITTAITTATATSPVGWLSLRLLDFRHQVDQTFPVLGELRIDWNEKCKVCETFTWALFVLFG